MVELLPFGLLCFYLVPFVVAAARGHDSTGTILAANLLIGWTVVGWIFVLVWACLAPQAPRGQAAQRANRKRANHDPKPRILHGAVERRSNS